jgi:hypothetical protein
VKRGVEVRSDPKEGIHTTRSIYRSSGEVSRLNLKAIAIENKLRGRREFARRAFRERLDGEPGEV